MRNLLLSGGPGHDFESVAASLDGLLAEVGFMTTIVMHPDEMFDALGASTDPDSQPFDLITVHALHWQMAAERYSHLRATQAYSLAAADAHRIEDFVTAGGGLLALHGAVVCFDAQPIWRRLCGAAWVWDDSGHPPLGPVSVDVTAAGRAGEIVGPVGDFELVDEIYGFLDEDPDLEPLLTGFHGGRIHPLLWARRIGRGRVVTDLLGHGSASIDHAVHRGILSRSALWACGRETHGH